MNTCYLIFEINNAKREQYAVCLSRYQISFDSVKPQEIVILDMVTYILMMN